MAQSIYYSDTKYLYIMDITIKDAYQVVEKVVSAGGNSGRVYVPRDWIGKRVKIVLLQPTNHDIVEDDKNA